MGQFEFYLVSMVCILSPMFLLLCTYITWQLSRTAYRITFIVDVIFFFVAYKLFSYYLFPAILRVFSNYRFVRLDGVDLSDLAQVYALETLSYGIWLLVFALVAKQFRSPNYINPAIQKKINIINVKSLDYKEALLMVFVSIGFIVHSLSLIFGFGSVIFELFRPLFTYGGMVVSVFLFALGLKLSSKFYIIVGGIASLFSLSYIQSRGALIYGLIWLLFLLFQFRMRRSLYAVVGLFIAVGSILFAFEGLPKLGFINPDTGQVSFNLEVDTNKTVGRSILEEIEWRFGANTRMSTSFIGMYERGDSAGINPILHSLQGFLPRSVNPDKPHPSTLVGDDIYSMGMYLAYREIHGYDTYSMVEFSSGAHFYWEFGLLGVVILSSISALYILFSSLFFQKLGIAGIPLTVVLFKPWGYMDPKIWVSDAILQFYQVIIPTVFLYFILWVFLPNMNRFFKFAAVSKH